MTIRSKYVMSFFQGKDFTKSLAVLEELETSLKSSDFDKSDKVHLKRLESVRRMISALNGTHVPEKSKRTVSFAAKTTGKSFDTIKTSPGRSAKLNKKNKKGETILQVECNKVLLKNLILNFKIHS